MAPLAINSPTHHSFSKYLLNTHYIPGPVLAPQDTVMNKIVCMPSRDSHLQAIEAWWAEGHDKGNTGHMGHTGGPLIQSGGWGRLLEEAKV